mmetsp:Transcript_55158/g.120172  ORF Transcript_55158/g.120172 Transcript_55158/m.120172 type:complete len:95 (+) Transcript_55158:413-697(+)
MILDRVGAPILQFSQPSNTPFTGAFSVTLVGSQLGYSHVRGHSAVVRVTASATGATTWAGVSAIVTRAPAGHGVASQEIVASLASRRGCLLTTA